MSKQSRMRSSPRKRSGAAGCSSPILYASEHDMLKTPIGELRHEASTFHGVKNANTMKKVDVIAKLKEHFRDHHGVHIDKHADENVTKEDFATADNVGADNHPVSETVDKLRTRIQGRKDGKKDLNSENILEKVQPECSEEGEVIESAERLLELAKGVLGGDANTEREEQHVNDVAGTLPEEVELSEISEEVVSETFDGGEIVYEEVIGESDDKLMEVIDDRLHYETDEPGQIVPTVYQEPRGDDTIIYQGDSDSNLAIDYGDYGEEVARNTVLSVSQDGDNIQYKVVSESVEYGDRADNKAQGMEITSTFDDGEYYTEPGGEMIIQMMPKVICNAYVIAKSVKELKDLGRDMLRVHAENHGIEMAVRMKMPELLKEVITHYNTVHDANLSVSKLDMLKLNMIQLKKVRVQIREKTPPPDTSKMVPKNVVPIEEQVHHVYEKRPDICSVDIIVNNLKDMLALGTSILRPEASKHRVANSSRKQKLQVVEELWEHYLKFHLKETESGDGVMERKDTGFIDESHIRYEDESERSYVYDTHPSQEDYIVVREEDIVQGEDIQTIAEEVTA